MNNDDDPGERVVALKESVPPHSVVVVEQNRYEPGHCTEYAFIYTQWAGYFLHSILVGFDELLELVKHNY